MSFYYQISEGIRITVRPVYSAAHSNPDERQHVFVYQVRIENTGDDAAQLVWRHWYIHDPVAGDSEVEGEGVVGQQPMLAPGDVHEYQSFCVLEAPRGHMEGFYEFRRADGSSFRAAVPRFVLHAPGSDGN